MTKWLMDNKKEDYNEIVILFSNTGEENEETLSFVDKCDKEWNLGVVWVEAVINPIKGKGTRHKIVDYESASRNGEPYERMIEKYGIPNHAGAFCTRELKLNPMQSYIKSIGWKKNDYLTAIGIRQDEMDRVSSRMVELGLVYPLCEDNKQTKESINLWWSEQHFNLHIREHEGNCKWCFKKSKRKLLTIAKATPEVFDFPIRMEKLHGKTGGHTMDEYRKFFRGRMSGVELLELSKGDFTPYIDGNYINNDMDAANGCSESCEVY